MVANKMFEHTLRGDIVHKEYDIIVAGGGTAGSIAAIVAAESGLKTLVIESAFSLGGSASNGQVTPMMSNYLPKGTDHSGVSRRLNKRMQSEGTAAVDGNRHDGWFNPEMLKFSLEEMLTECGCDILYDTKILDAVVEERKITGLVVHNRSGLQQYKGKVVIDATGDAAVAFKAGVPCFEGNDVTHHNQHMSLRFILGNVDIERAAAFFTQNGEPKDPAAVNFQFASLWSYKTAFSDLFRKAVEAGVIKRADANYIQAVKVTGEEGLLSFNCPEAVGFLRANDAECVSQAAIYARQVMRRLTVFFKTYIPGFEKCSIRSAASMMGIRESRRIQGEYLLTAKDYVNGVKFDDAIAQTAYPVDIHGADDDSGENAARLAPGEFVEVPLRSLIPVGIDNLVAAGRCISADFLTQSSIRVQPTCRATGEAAGFAAVLAVKNAVPLREISGKDVRERMIAGGGVFVAG